MFGRLRPKLLPMNKLLISKSNILYNLGYLQGLRPQTAVFPVLKSNAYGHGLVEMTKILETYKTPYLVVDSVPEYLLARDYTSKRFLLIGETNPANYMHCDREQLTIAVYNIETIKYLLTTEEKFRIHLFLDTGMHREGILPAQLTAILDLIQHDPAGRNLTIDGVMSHLASADSVSQTMVDQQISCFKELYTHILEYGHTPTYRHIGNSASLLSTDTQFFNAWRPGLALYGYNPLPADHPSFAIGQKLKPALTRTSSLISSRVIPADASVSYVVDAGVADQSDVEIMENMDMLQEERSTEKVSGNDSMVVETGSGDAEHAVVENSGEKIIFTLPVGYKEGLPRAASGKLIARLLANDMTEPVYLTQTGTICMNLSCRTPSYVAEAINFPLHHPVELISSDGTAPNSLAHLAAAANTIVYECLVRLDPMMRREIV